MKKLVFASAMALAGMCLVSTPALRAHGQTIQIQAPAEFNAIRTPPHRTIRRKSARRSRVFSRPIRKAPPRRLRSIR